jgi:hypothetical protein
LVKSVAPAVGVIVYAALADWPWWSVRKLRTNRLSVEGRDTEQLLDTVASGRRDEPELGKVSADGWDVRIRYSLRSRHVFFSLSVPEYCTSALVFFDCYAFKF